jgi:hypothetical protein
MEKVKYKRANFLLEFYKRDGIILFNAEHMFGLIFDKGVDRRVDKHILVKEIIQSIPKLSYQQLQITAALITGFLKVTNINHSNTLLTKEAETQQNRQ